MVVVALRIAHSHAKFAAEERSQPIPRGRKALLIEHVAQAARQAPRGASPRLLRFLALIVVKVHIYLHPSLLITLSSGRRRPPLPQERRSRCVRASFKRATWLIWSIKWYLFLFLLVLFAIWHPILVIDHNRDTPLGHCRISLHFCFTRNKRMI